MQSTRIPLAGLAVYRPTQIGNAKRDLPSQGIQLAPHVESVLVGQVHDAFVAIHLLRHTAMRFLADDCVDPEVVEVKVMERLRRLQKPRRQPERSFGELHSLYARPSCSAGRLDESTWFLDLPQRPNPRKR